MIYGLYSFIFLAVVLAISCPSVVAFSQGDCLSYEPSSVTLTGKIFRKVFPGRPNYESLKAGDEPERPWLLHLTKPICINAEKQHDFNVAENKVSVLHLVLRGKQFSKLRRLRKKGAVTLTDSLFHSFSPHHHADVLMWVTRIQGQSWRANSTLQAQNARSTTVPITNVSGVKLRQSPATNASVVGELGVGDEVEVLRNAVGARGNEADELWTFVKPYRSMKGDLDSHQPGWVLDKHLGYKSRFQKITSWEKEHVSGELGDYSFTITIRRDGSFVHKYAPCVDCSEKPDCDKGEKKVGSDCVSRGHLYRYGNFVWARKPTKYQEYFFTDKQGKLRSVYPEDR